ncbi:hypothetical protein MMC30_005399 [Trapelia coarctata]|nr:hypothetical protein [Trapelia coarctata]
MAETTSDSGRRADFSPDSNSGNDEDGTFEDAVADQIPTATENLQLSRTVDAAQETTLAVSSEGLEIRRRTSHSSSEEALESRQPHNSLSSSDKDDERPLHSDGFYEYSDRAASEAGTPSDASPIFDWAVLEDKLRADEAFVTEVERRRGDPRRVLNVDALNGLLKGAGRSTSSKKIIRLTDAIGRDFVFPFEQCRTWAGMKKLISDVFTPVDPSAPYFEAIRSIAPSVEQGWYHLRDPEGNIILPAFWDPLVEPGWSVSMTVKKRNPPSRRSYVSEDESPVSGYPNAAKSGRIYSARPPKKLLQAESSSSHSNSHHAYAGEVEVEIPDSVDANAENPETKLSEVGELWTRNTDITTVQAEDADIGERQITIFRAPAASVPPRTVMVPEVTANSQSDHDPLVHVTPERTSVEDHQQNAVQSKSNELSASNSERKLHIRKMEQPSVETDKESAEGGKGTGEWIEAPDGDAVTTGRSVNKGTGKEKDPTTLNTPSLNGGRSYLQERASELHESYIIMPHKRVERLNRSGDSVHRPFSSDPFNPPMIEISPSPQPNDNDTEEEAKWDGRNWARRIKRHSRHSTETSSTDSHSRQPLRSSQRKPSSRVPVRPKLDPYPERHQNRRRSRIDERTIREPRMHIFEPRIMEARAYEPRMYSSQSYHPRSNDFHEPEYARFPDFRTRGYSYPRPPPESYESLRSRHWGDIPQHPWNQSRPDPHDDATAPNQTRPPAAEMFDVPPVPRMPDVDSNSRLPRPVKPPRMPDVDSNSRLPRPVKPPRMPDVDSNSRLPRPVKPPKRGESLRREAINPARIQRRLIKAPPMSSIASVISGTPNLESTWVARSRSPAQAHTQSQQEGQSGKAATRTQSEEVFYYSSSSEAGSGSEEDYPERTHIWKEITPMSRQDLSNFHYNLREEYRGKFVKESQFRDRIRDFPFTRLLDAFPSLLNNAANEVWYLFALNQELVVEHLMLALFSPADSRYWTVDLQLTQKDYHLSQSFGLQQTLRRLKSVNERMGHASWTTASWSRKRESGSALEWPMWKLQNLCYRRGLLPQPKAHEKHLAQQHRKYIHGVFCAMNYKCSEVDLITLNEVRWTAEDATRCVGDAMEQVVEKRKTSYRALTQTAEPLFEAADLSIKALLEIGKINLEWTFSADKHLRMQNTTHGKRVLFVLWDPSLLWITCGYWDDFHKWPEIMELKRTYAILFRPSRTTSLRKMIGSDTAYVDLEASAESKTFSFAGPINEAELNESYPFLPAPPSAIMPENRKENASLTLKNCPSYYQATMLHLEAVKTSRLNEMEEFGSYPIYGDRLREIQWYMDKSRPRGIFALWRDRRDSLAWYTLWAAIAFGSTSLFLAFSSVVISAVQTKAAFQALSQPQGAVPTSG